MHDTEEACRLQLLSAVMHMPLQRYLPVAESVLHELHSGCPWLLEEIHSSIKVCGVSSIN